VADGLIGTEFAGYRVDSLLGRGGMGVVYRATDLSLDRSVALKLIAPTLADDDDFRRRFIAESKVAASLDHPNVIPIYQAGDWEGSLFLVMRFVAGDDLRTLIRGEGRLAPPRAARITAQIGAALDAAHGGGLVHRDVKPANVLVTADDHVYLTDFGLTKRLAANADETQSEQILGTVDYVAPEQIKGQRAGPASDVYALGCLLFHALSGHVPYRLETTEAKLWAHMSEEPPSVSGAAPGVPIALDAVVAKAMSKRPEDRFATAGELGEAAQAAAGPTPPATPAVSKARATAEGMAARMRRKAWLSHTLPDGVESRRELIVRALLEPFNLVVLAGMLVAGALLGALPLTVPFAAAVYAVAAAWSYRLQDARRGELARSPAPSPSRDLSTHPPKRARPDA
jgi:serine/threonine protein kinase